MLITHRTKEGSATGSSVGDVSLLLRGQRSFYLLFPESRQTRYEGLYLTDEADTPHRYWKFVERLEHAEGEAIRSIERSSEHLVIRYASGQVVIRIDTTRSDCAILDIESTVPLTAGIDMRHIYSYPTENRSYTHHQHPGWWSISYTDPTLEKTLWLSYRGGVSSPTQSWQQASYPRDAARHSPPELLWITWVSLPPGTHRFVASLNNEPQESTLDLQIQPPPRQRDTILTSTQAAILGAQETLSVLTTKSGLYAGLPWFHQVWSRDDLIGSLGLSAPARVTVLERYLAIEPHEGELPTYFGSNTVCADGLGWLALLARETESHLSPEIRSKLGVYFTHALEALIAHRFDTDRKLIRSHHNATWMDTIGREGFRVEIQAMALLVSELSEAWDGSKSWEAWRAALVSEVFTQLCEDGRLLDGIETDGTPDTRVRPNTLLALLVYPNLVPRDIWLHTIETTLSECQTSWGGLASLSQFDSGFQAVSAGESNASYHQGDNWLMLDGLSATALLRFDTSRYRDAAERIIRASTEECLWRHTLGFTGEIRAAGDSSSWGCGVQAFSAGGYLLACEEVGR